MALVANGFGQMARAGGTYIAGRAVQALADRVSNAITTTSPQDINSALARFAPGKRNKAARNAARRMLINTTLRSTRNTLRIAPTAVAQPAPRFQPRFNSIRGRYCVANKEFMSNLAPTSAGSSELSVLSYNAQVGLGDMFPWLSTIANTHQRYIMKRLRFEYVPVAGTTTRGRVVMAFTIDPTEAAPISMSQITQYPNYEANSVWTPITLNVDLSDRRDELYTRSGNVLNTDIKTYDLGKLFVGISDTTDTNTIGQLFVDYEVELITPKPASCPASNDTFITGVGTTSVFGLSEGDTVDLVGATATAFRDVAGTHIRFNAPGVYYLALIGTGTGTPTLSVNDGALDGNANTMAIVSSTTQTTRVVTVTVVSPSNLMVTGGGTSLSSTRVMLSMGTVTSHAH